MQPFAYNEVSRLLSTFHSIGDAHASKFNARLKNFQRLGFPEGVNTGKGQRARYGTGEVLLLNLALELTQLGLTPERAVNVLLENAYVVLPAVRIAAEWLAAREQTSMYLYLDPSALSPLGVGGTSDDQASDTFFYAGWPDLRARLERKHAPRRLAIINLSSVLDGLIEGLQRMELGTRDEFLKSLLAWADMPRDDEES